jgi:hypothetical protein
MSRKALRVRVPDEGGDAAHHLMGLVGCIASGIRGLADRASLCVGLCSLGVWVPVFFAAPPPYQSWHWLLLVVGAGNVLAVVGRTLDRWLNTGADE